MAREAAQDLAAAAAKNPPYSVRTRRWYMDQLEREVAMETAPLTEDFHQAARAFAEKRQPGPFKGR